MPLLNTVVSTELLIDTRNKSLWEDVIAKYNVDIQPSENAEYSCYTQSSNVIFYIPITDICASSFTHELLHVYIRLKDVYFGSGLQTTFTSSNILSRIFVPGLTEYVANCLDHIKMLPIYLELGFEREKFLFDYHENKGTETEIRLIKDNYKSKARYNTSAVGNYIAKYYAMKADPNNTFDYRKSLSILRTVDDKLFAILEKFLKNWYEFDIDKNDFLNGYHYILDNFYQEMKKWMTGKSFL